MSSYLIVTIRESKSGGMEGTPVEPKEQQFLIPFNNDIEANTARERLMRMSDFTGMGFQVANYPEKVTQTNPEMLKNDHPDVQRILNVLNGKTARLTDATRSKGTSEEFHSQSSDPFGN